MNELSMCFLGMGILMGIFGGMNETEIAEEFINGVKDIAFAAMVIGFCSGIMVIAQDGMIIDTILNALSGLVEKSNNVVFSAVMYVVQSLLTLLVPSSSGLAALSMPIMAPLCDLHGVNPEAAVTALQYGNQLTNLMSSRNNSSGACNLQDFIWTVVENYLENVFDHGCYSNCILYNFSRIIENYKIKNINKRRLLK